MSYLLWKTLTTLPWGPETYVVLRISWLLPSAFPPPPPPPNRLPNATKNTVTQDITTFAN